MLLLVDDRGMGFHCAVVSGMSLRKRWAGMRFITVSMTVYPKAFRGEVSRSPNRFVRLLRFVAILGGGVYHGDGGLREFSSLGLP